jgi:hypothetical protein
MKKIFTLMMVVLATIAARATDYNESIVVSVNGEASEQRGIISVEEKDGLYDLTMKNFVLMSEDGATGVGNISLKGIKSYKAGDATLLFANDVVTITEGDDPNVIVWLAPMLPPVPVELSGKIENGHLRCFLNIDLMATLQQQIKVTIGSGYQLSNQSLEDWHTTTEAYVEPNAWHSFESASGTLAPFAGHHIDKSADAHSGKASARLYSTSIFGIIANGTMTTGRMNAGSFSATDPANHAFLDMSQSDVDGNGDPFYSPLYSRPDSIALWVKFKQGTANAAHPFATVSAVITDGTFYQDPEDKEYSNVVAKAKYNTIAETSEWVRVVAPFNYVSETLAPKAVLVTVSTNADAGQGSNGDELLVDDIEFVYNAKMTGLKIKGQDVADFDPDKKEYAVEVSGEVTEADVEAQLDSRAALVQKTIEAVENGYQLTLKVLSGDMATATVYVVNIKSTASGIKSMVSSTAKNNDCYNLNGQRVMQPRKGLYIVGGKKVVMK